MTPPSIPCPHSAAAGTQRRDDTGYCVAHGGGRQCQDEGCSKAAAAGGTPHCQAHGGAGVARRAAPSQYSSS
jgi:hypothetical protein